MAALGFALAGLACATQGDWVNRTNNAAVVNLTGSELILLKTHLPQSAKRGSGSLKASAVPRPLARNTQKMERTAC